MGADVREATKAAYRKLRSERKDLRARDGQRLLIARVAEAVAAGVERGKAARGERILVAQAATGSGKTLGYGIGAIPGALGNGKRVVISTATVTLQEQIVSKDMAALRSCIPGLVDGIAKGRGRYGCILRLQKAAASSESLAALLESFESGEWNGDRDALGVEVPEAEWQSITNDSRGCTGASCSKRSVCPYYKARDALRNCNVIVTNHDLLIAELMHEGGQCLPKQEDTVFILDEGHQLPEKATRAVATSFVFSDAARWFAKSARVLVDLSQASMDSQVNDACVRGTNAARVARENTLRISEALGDWLRSVPENEAGEILLDDGMMRGPFGRDARDCLDQVHGLSQALAQCVSLLKGEVGSSLVAARREQLMADLGEVAGAIESVHDTWGLVCSKGYGESPVARWVQPAANGLAADLRIHASPTTAAQMLDELLWTKACAVVACSATLRGVGEFAPYLRESGMDRSNQVQTLVVDSPFAFEERTRLVVPKVGASAKDADAHTARLIELVPKALESVRVGSGALMLFSSLKQMRDVAEGMPQEIKASLLVQGSMGKKALLEAHRKAISEKRCSFIFGCQSFEEGLDLPGRLCEMVLIARLPFTVPSGAVERVRRASVERSGGNYFKQVAVPHAFRRLAQQTGRLMRTESDRGTVVVFDERLTDTEYGREMLAALPPYPLERRMPGEVELPW